MIKAIAIDGPSASGKSTIAKMLAKKLKMNYLDTGAMYRAITLYVLNKGIDPEDEGAVNGILSEIDLSVVNNRVILNGEDVTGLIRTDAIDKAVSPVSSFGPVRKMLVAMQRKIGKETSVILDGRDIGTVVLPDAALKIFLTASPEVRAQRRMDDRKSSSNMNFDQMLEAVKRRDYLDSHREISPLKPADDAIILDSSDMGLDEVVAEIENLWKERQCTQ